ncbi:hypothetical protein [Allomuricauda sp. F6463D]|uniref:hypothetical protein n=1 Tax=Allomuricauda sp. F6463D TaxID=2926409 RepID=UPI001FF468C6|nr:hypothetical protein [Muricauda sp. F6463D]MCK0159869.1 hypothetical protein [Muricauda sp. F6463D]
MKRTYTAILLLFSLIAPIGGSFLLLHFQKQHLRKEIRKTINQAVEEGEFVVLEFTMEQIKTELRWEHSMEFEYKGQMYDVIEKENKGGYMVLKCWWDKEETALNQEMDELLARALGADPLRKDKHTRLFDFFKKLFYQHHKPDVGQEEFYRKLLFAQCQECFDSLFFKPLFPPPRIC